MTDIYERIGTEIYRALPSQFGPYSNEWAKRLGVAAFQAVSGMKIGRVALTGQQLKVLRFIKFYVDLHGISPTMDEIGNSVGYKSKSSVVKILIGLEERGAITRFRYRARAIGLTLTGIATCGDA